jgi:hypothetical protein
MAFVDLEKAFDNVNWKILFNVMNNVGIDIKDRNILHAIYKNQEAEIKINSTTKTANLQKGVRQGCPLSPSLFNVYVELAIRDIKQKLEEQMIGVVIVGILIPMICFADDIVLLATSENDLQTAIIEMDNIFLEFKLNKNSEKTKVMICSKQNEPNINISLKGKIMEQINQFKYLGSIIDNEGRSKKEIKSRIGQAKKAFLLKSKLLTSNNVDQRTRKHLIKTYVWSTALYDCGTWTLNKKEETTLEAFEMWCWRKMKKIKWTELKTNEEVLDLVKKKRTLLNNLRSRRWHIIGHTLRHNEELLASYWKV